MSVNPELDEFDLDGDEPLEADFVLPTKEADQAAPEVETDTPTEPVKTEGQAAPTDPETRAIELEFELGSLKDQIEALKGAAEFLEDAKKDPMGVIGALAARDPRFMPALEALKGTPSQAPATAPAWKVRPPVQDAYGETTSGYASEQEFMDDIAANVAAALGPVREEIARLKADVEAARPHFEQARAQTESEARSSATVNRVLGVQKLIDIESESRNYGWKPTKEQLTEFAKKNPGVLDGATDARSVAKAVVEKLRLAHFDDIMNARSAGKGKPDGSNRAAVRTGDGRGATSEYDARRQRAGRIVHSGD